MTHLIEPKVLQSKKIFPFIILSTHPFSDNPNTPQNFLTNPTRIL